MRKIIAATTAAIALVIAGPAFAGGGSSTSLSLSAGAGGDAGIKGTIEGGTYAIGKNGSDAFAQSKNGIKTFGVSKVELGQSDNFGHSSSWGKSLAKTSGRGAQAEAFETRKLKFDNFTRFNADVSLDKDFSGFGGF